MNFPSAFLPSQKKPSASSSTAALRHTVPGVITDHTRRVNSLQKRKIAFTDGLRKHNNASKNFRKTELEKHTSPKAVLLATCALERQFSHFKTENSFLDELNVELLQNAL